MLAVIGWPLLLAFAGVAVASALQAVRFAREDGEEHKIHVSWSWAACAGSVCLAVFSATLAGVISAVAGAILWAVTALVTLAVMWEDARQPEGDDGIRGFGKAAGDTVIAAAWAVRSLFDRSGGGAGTVVRDDLESLRERRRDAPAPALPPADGPAGPRLAMVAGNIPPDHAAAHQRIASFEPEGLTAFIHFLTSEARGLTGYGDAFGSCMDNLIFGPGVPPEALKAGFDFADMFAEVAAMANMTAKRVLDYFAGHLEWAESHDPTKDGHWTIRE